MDTMLMSAPRSSVLSGEFGHYDYQCLSKSQHIDNVQIDDILMI